MRNDRPDVWMQWTDAAAALDLGPAVVLRLIEDRVLPSEETDAGLVLVRRVDVDRLRELAASEPRPAEPFARLELRRRRENVPG